MAFDYIKYNGEPATVSLVYTPNQMPVSTPILAATPTPTPSYAPQTACDNPYYPLRLGATWTYLNSAEGEEKESISAIIGDMITATAIHTYERGVVDEPGYFKVETTFGCGPQGIVHQSIEAYAVGISGDFKGRANQSYTSISDQSGSLLPSFDSFVLGFAWNYGYTMSTASNITSVRSEECTVVGFEPLNVGGESLDTVRVQCAKLDHNPKHNEILFGTLYTFIEQKFTSDETRWYAFGIGLVRQEDSGKIVDVATGKENSYSYTRELTAYSIP